MKERNAGKSWGITTLTAVALVLVGWFGRELMPTFGGAAAVGIIERFRAVMMTAFTFVLGVLPLVWATGAGANARRSIGITTFSGMLASSLVGILFVPVLFSVFQRLGDWCGRRSDLNGD